MPYERAGRADKQGNRYEIKWCVYQLLKVLDEKLDYIILEAIGDDEAGVDLWVGHKDGRKEGQQCKGRNGPHEIWNYGTLNSKSILRNWKFQLGRGNNIYVSLVSPLAFTYLEDLVHRAKNSGEQPNLFYEHQIKGSDVKFIQFARNFCQALGFDISDEDQYQLDRMINYLCRIEYRQSPEGERKEIILDKIGLLFRGDEREVYNAFVTWIIDGDILGEKIDINKIHSFLKLKKIKLRNLDFDTRIYPKIQELNNEYKKGFRPLDTGMIRGAETDNCINQILDGNSIIIHGLAGSGKSGLTDNVIKHCEDKGVPYLALKLDINIPRQNVQQWSESIGLPTSLVHCLNSISKDTKLYMTVKYFEIDKYVIPAKDLILKFNKHGFDLEASISRLLNDNLIDMERDKEFLCQILGSKFSRRIAYVFNKYIEESTESIVYFSNLIFQLSYSIIEIPDTQVASWGAEDEITKLIIGLYDETSGLTELEMRKIAEECLDIWDLMFEKQIGSARKLSFELMKR